MHEFIVSVDCLVEKLQKAFCVAVSVLASISDPDTESSATSGDMQPVGAVDAPSADGFSELVLFVVADQEAMFGEVSSSFAMRKLKSFDIFWEAFDFVL